MKRALTFLVLTGVLLTLLPINLHSKEKEILARLDQLVETLERMERKGDVQSTEVSQIYAKLKVVLSNLETLQKKQIEQEQANESVLKQLQNLKERIDELTKSVNNIYQSPNTQAAPSSEKGSGETAAASVNGAKGAAENTAKKPPKMSSQELYYSAYSDYLKGDFDLAVQSFRDYLNNYGDSPFADNALYWIGECFYSQGKYSQAISSFDEVLAKYPQGDKIPGALLKKGFSLIESGKSAEGMAVLKRVLNDYPLSEEAGLAEQRIKQEGNPSSKG